MKSLKEINQNIINLHFADLQVELAERLLLEMEKHNITNEQLVKMLDKDEYYVVGILEGLVDLKLSEISELFLVFNKLVKIIPEDSYITK